MNIFARLFGKSAPKETAVVAVPLTPIDDYPSPIRKTARRFPGGRKTVAASLTPMEYRRLEKLMEMNREPTIAAMVRVLILAAIKDIPEPADEEPGEQKPMTLTSPQGLDGVTVARQQVKKVQTFITPKDLERAPEGRYKRTSALTAVAELALEGISAGTLEYKTFNSGGAVCEPIKLGLGPTHHEILKRLAKEKSVPMGTALASVLQAGLRHDYL